jgi:hypothetical protein
MVVAAVFQSYVVISGSHVMSFPIPLARVLNARFIIPAFRLRNDAFLARLPSSSLVPSLSGA